jgi:hypothetical protein
VGVIGLGWPTRFQHGQSVDALVALMPLRQVQGAGAERDCADTQARLWEADAHSPSWVDQARRVYRCLSDARLAQLRASESAAYASEDAFVHALDARPTQPVRVTRLGTEPQTDGGGRVLLVLRAVPAASGMRVVEVRLDGQGHIAPMPEDNRS